MGVVYLAEQDQPRRRVALKVVHAVLTSDAALRRFEYESSVLARLRHPCIAQIYDVGSFESPTGGKLPYFAMELVEGASTLVEHARARALALEKRIELFLRVLEGVLHGHQRGVVHRDLKPGNILVDGDGNPRIIDFGVARVSGGDDGGGSLHTSFGQILGTLEYMSPEQFAGDPEELDVRADVYSMGAVLYELASGRIPFEFRGRSIVDIGRVIREESPQRLSTVDARLRGDLSTIVEKAMEKDRERRYPSASAFAADLQRFLRREPISARPASAFYQARLFARRNRTLVGGLVAVVLVSIVGMVVSTRFALLASSRAEQRERQAYRANLLAAGLSLDAGQVATARLYLDTVPENVRGFEWKHLDGRMQMEERILPSAGSAAVLAVSSDGESFAAPLSEGRLALWNLTGNASEPARVFDLPGPTLQSVAFSRNGADLLALGASATWLCRFALDDGSLVSRTTFDIGSSRAGCALTADGARCAILLPDSLAVYDTSSGAKLASRELRDEISAESPLQFSSDGSRLAALGPRGSLCALDGRKLSTLRVLTVGDVRVRCFAFDEKSRRIATGAEDARVRVWDLEAADGTSPVVLEGHGALVVDVAFSPSGEDLASVANDGTLRVWDLERRTCRVVLREHYGGPRAVSYWPDGERLATIGEDRTLRVQDLAILEEPTVLRGHASYVNPVAVTENGRRIISGGWDGFVGKSGALRWWDTASGTEIARWGENAILTHLALSPDGRWIAVVDHERDLVLLDARTGEVHGKLSSAPTAVAFTPESDRLVLVVDEGSKAVLLDRETLAQERELEGSGPRSIAISRNGAWLARKRDDWNGELYDTRSTTPRARFECIPGGMLLSSTGERLAIVNPDGIDLYDPLRGERLGKLDVKEAWTVAFSPDGTRIAAGMSQGIIQLWDARSLDEVGQLLGHTGYIYELTFTPDGTALVSSSGDGTLRIWETQAISERLRARRARNRLVPELEPRIRALFEGGRPPAEIVDAISSDPSFTEPREREIALQLALRESLARPGTKQ
jgi:WD40 repeat protein